MPYTYSTNMLVAFAVRVEVFCGLKFMSGESTTTLCLVNYQLLA